MKVTLAGITHCPGAAHEPPATPESITAAYARISRSPRTISELRRRAARDIETTRAFNRKIVFHLGHESVAEHAVFNLDILGITRLAVEAVEHSRLVSYTERSQRYVRIGSDFHIPVEFREMGLSTEFAAACRSQHRRYEALVRELGTSYSLQGAKEDARYALGLATTTQLGMTINARALGMMIARLAAHELSECRSLALKLATVAGRVAPSLIPDIEDDSGTREASEDTGPSTTGEPVEYPRLLWHTQDAAAITAALIEYPGRTGPLPGTGALYGQTGNSYRERETGQFVSSRALEAVHFAFELCISASCFAQLKRHRMATIIPQAYDPLLGITIPPAIGESGASDLLLEGAMEAGELSKKTGTAPSCAGSYPLINAHRRRVLFIINARSFRNMLHLRLDRHAQWDIREQSRKMRSLVLSRIPELEEILPRPS